MKNQSAKDRTGAFTLVELLTVIAIIGILAAMLMPVLVQAKVRAKRIQCVNNLRETGIGFHLFANDHDGKFPTQVSTNDGGALEFVIADYQMPGHRFYFAFQYFRTLAGDLGTPKLFACPGDLQRWPATNFSQFNNWNLSYVMGLKANLLLPGAILAADRSFPSCRRAPVCVPNPTLGLIPFSPASWGTAFHEREGNVLFSDSHVEESFDKSLPLEETIAEILIYPEVHYPEVMTTYGISPEGGTGDAGGPNNFPASSAKLVLSPSTPVSISQQIPVKVSPAHGNSIGANSPGGSSPSVFNSQFVPTNSSHTISVIAQRAETPQTSGVDVFQTATNTVTATDNDSGMSSFDLQTVKILRKVFGWGYFLLLLLFLLLALLELSRRSRKNKEKNERRESFLDSES